MRLTNVFSKQEGGEPKAAMLHFTHYNFERNHRTIRCTPATEARIASYALTVKTW